MARRRRNQGSDLPELIAKFVGFGIILLSLAIGGVTGFPKVLGALSSLVLMLIGVALAIGVVGLVVYLAVKRWPRSATDGWPKTDITETSVAVSANHLLPPLIKPTSSAVSVAKALGEIDWFQFEKFCAALLRTEGFDVERKGGAQPDGGVDLIATKGEERLLVQCKHWRTWMVQEKVIREMLGSMTHFGVTRGAIYTLKGWTSPAGDFARQHQIALVDEAELVRRALARLSADQLDQLLKSREHHCPKCESPMIWREGDFTPFWGCSTYPRCRGKLNHAGAR